MYSLPDINRVVRTMKWVGHIAYISEDDKCIHFSDTQLLVY